MSDMRSQPSKQKFTEAVERSFDFLVREFGFSREPISPDKRDFRVAYESDRTRVVVQGTNWGLNARVAIGRAGRFDAFENFDLDDLIAVRGGFGHASARRGSMTEGSTQLEQIAYYAHALRSMAEDVLRGDFTIFPVLQEEIDNRARHKPRG